MSILTSRSSPVCSGRKCGGLTLVELMVTLSLLAILILIAFPGFQSQIASSKLRTTTNELMSTMTRARAEAMRLGTRITVCRSNSTNTGCSTSTTEGWQTGWILFQDPTRSGTSAAVDTGETVTFKVQAISSGISLTSDTDMSKYVSFAADGRAKTMTGGSLVGRIRVCSTSPALSNSTRARELVLTPSGRIIIETPANIDPTCPAPT